MIFGGLACKNNPFAKYTKQYNCTIAGEPEPATSEDYINRALKHKETFMGDCFFAALNEALRLDPNNTDVLRLRSFGYRRNEQFDLALADYNKVIQIEPNNPDNYHLRSIVYIEKELFDHAIDD